MGGPKPDTTRVTTSSSSTARGFYRDTQNILDTCYLANGINGYVHWGSAGSSYVNSNVPNNRWGYGPPYDEYTSGIGWIEHYMLHWPDQDIIGNTPW